MSPGDSSSDTTLETGGGDFLSRVNLTINNFKELVKLAREFKGSFPGEENEPVNHTPPGRSPGLADYVQLAIQAGYGEVPIGKLLEQISPYTLNQIMRMVRSAGPKR